MRFKPTNKDSIFFDLLCASAKCILEGVELLEQIINANLESRSVIRDELHLQEHKADENTHELINTINQSFITPLERDDLINLMSSLDDCMDYIDEVGDLFVLYKIQELPEPIRRGFTEQIEVLRQCAKLTVEATPRIQSLHDLRDYWIEINRLENVGDIAYRRMLSDLFDCVSDPVQIIKFKDMILATERAVDAFERFANAIEDVAIKES
ncbi:DUF47 family protein [Actinomyces sp. zg-332]|uniref:DUF47 domain-containing protein n=1 Tax=Actinomyces sp. zg-332 TaxID=2708340 RepID=UPI001423798C|nr:DUF47 family protein [Actinomyces sp. zg-332]QPK94200.1 DUF47 family protein [Actinomyces sp. zg-332]